MLGARPVVVTTQLPESATGDPIAAGGREKRRPRSKGASGVLVHTGHMTTKIKTSRVPKLLLGICLTLWVSACTAADDAEPPTDESSTLAPTSVEELDDGNVALYYDEEAMEAASETDFASESEASLARNCVYIEYCKSPSTGGIVCRSRHCGCTAQQAIDECVRDAQAVCGHANAMCGRVCTDG